MTSVVTEPDLFNRYETVAHALAKPHIRWLIRHDLPEVLDIERRAFRCPWIEDDFLRVLRQRNCIGMVAERGDRNVGYMVYELHKTRIQLVSLAVHPEDSRTGIGAALVSKLIAKLAGHQRVRIATAVRESNLAALLFFRSLGFRAYRTVHDYYVDTAEAGILMEYRQAPAGGSQ